MVRQEERLIPIKLVGKALSSGIPAAREALSSGIPAAPTSPSRLTLVVTAFGVMLLAAYYFNSARHRHAPSDSIPVVATVARMHSHGDRDLTNLVLPVDSRILPATGLPYYLCRVTGRPGVYSSYPAGMELFAWPWVITAALAGKNLDDPGTRSQIEAACAISVNAVTIALLFLAALRLGPPLAAGIVVFLLATGSVFPTTLGQVLWQQTGVVFWMMVVLVIEIRAVGRVGPIGTIAQGVACAMMIACRPSAATFILPFGVWVLARSPRRAAVLVVASLVAYLPWAALYQSVYDQPFGPAISFITGNHSSNASQQIGNGWELGRSLDGVLFSPGRGLVIYQPWIILTPMLFSRSIRNNSAHPTPRGWYAFALAFLAFHLAVVGSWRCWWGGVCWGSRLAAEVVPVCGLLAVRPIAGLMAQRWWAAVVVTVAIAGLAVHAPAMFGSALQWNARPPGVDADPSRLWDWSQLVEAIS